MTDESDWFSLEELAGRIGALVWVEQRIFEILGRWSIDEQHHRARIAFASASRHHGWHAELLLEALPTSPQLEANASVAAPTAGWKRAVHQLCEMGGLEARLLSLVRVVDPWIARETAVLIDLANPVSDAAVTRLLEFVEIDHQRDGHRFAELLDETRTNTAGFDDHRAVHTLDLS